MHMEEPVPAVMHPPRLITFPFWKWTWKSCRAGVAIVPLAGVFPCSGNILEAVLVRRGAVPVGIRTPPLGGVWVSIHPTCLLRACWGSGGIKHVSNTTKIVSVQCSDFFYQILQKDNFDEKTFSISQTQILKPSVFLHGFSTLSYLFRQEKCFN